jgi:hypothetical protein
MVHPQVGELVLHREKLVISGGEGQILALYHAQPGSSSAEKPALLASLSAEASADRPVPAPDGASN